MPPREPAKRAVPPVGGSGSSIEVLPDSVLEHILGFLPSPEAVQTSVLARRWRHLWKSATGLNVGCGSVPISVEELRSLMNHLLILRQGSPLEKCKLEFDGYSGHDDVPHVNLWFRQVVMCKVQVLRLCANNDGVGDPWLELDNLRLVSKHLTRLELDGVRVHSSLLNFSHCPALEYLAINESNLTSVNKIVSESLKHLTIYDTACSYDSRIHIYAPKMVSLRIDYPRERTPMLEKMPELVQGFVRINDECTDRCNGPNYETCDCKSCDTSDNMADGCRNNCVLLNGVSEAQNLALISVSEMFIFKRDLRWCPMFQKLKILLLNDYWCVPDDFWALACILQHSPVLEKLTLQLFSEGPEPKVLMKLRVDPTKRSGAISKNLKKVELKREVVDVRVLKVLKFLSTFNIYFNFE